MQGVIVRAVRSRLSPINSRLFCQARWTSTQVPSGADRESSGPPTAEPQGGSFDTSQLDTLVCPISKSKLRWDADRSELISEELNVAYPVVNGVPRLTPESARDMSSPMPGGSPGDLPPQPS